MYEEEGLSDEIDNDNDNDIVNEIIETYGKDQEKCGRTY